MEAQQVWGGHGYISENGMAQFVRDAHIAMIYEGANGVHGVFAFFKLIDDFVAENKNEKLATYTQALVAARKDLEAATMWFMENALANPDNAGAGSSDYLHLFGVTSVAYMWALMARAALAKLEAGEGNKAFYETKLKTARYYMDRVVPETTTLLARVRVGAEPLMAFTADEF